MILNKKYFSIYFLIFFSILSFGQENKVIVRDSTKVEKLHEVIVTATRTIRQLSSLPLPAQIVSKKEIKSINALRLNDILSEQTGLTIVRDHGEGLQMQGLDSDYTLILIDGMPLIGRTAGTLDLSRIAVGNIKQVEIVKGASSSLYGSEALAGVINIITENPKNGFIGLLNYRAGAFNTHNINTSINYKKNKLGLNLFIDRYSTSGYDLDKKDILKTVDPYTNYTFSSKLNYLVSDKTTVSLSGRYYSENQDAMPTLVIKEKNKLNEWNTHLKVKHKYSKKWNSYFDFYATQYKTDSYLNTIDGTRNSESDFNQLMVRPELRAFYNPKKNASFIGGLGWTHETLDRTYFSNSPIFNAPYVYLQYDTNPNKKLNIILGVRYDSHNEYKSQFSPKAAFRYEFNDAIAIKGSAGYGYKAPDFRQLYLDFTNPTAGYTVIGYNEVITRLPELQNNGEIINALVPLSQFEGALRPENSLSFNLGTQLKVIPNVNIEVNLFRNNIKDLIDTQIIARKTNGQNVFSYKNISKVYTQGLELNASWKPNNQLKVSAGYQYLIAKDEAAEEAFNKGEVFARLAPASPTFQLKKNHYIGLFNRSKHMANAKVFYIIPEWKLNSNLRATYRSDYGLHDTNGNTYLDSYDDLVKGYTIIDFAINKTLYKNYQLGFGIDNLLNFTDSQNISNIAGRLIYGKLNIQF